MFLFAGEGLKPSEDWDLGLVVQILLLLVTALSAFAVAVQAYYVGKAAKDDLERRRIQSTIDDWLKQSQRRHELWSAIPAELRSMDRETARRLVKSGKNSADPGRQALIRYLGWMESYALGVNIGVYDFGTFARLAGGATTKRIRGIRFYIAEVQRQRNPSAYTELMKLFVDLRVNAYEARDRRIRMSQTGKAQRNRTSRRLLLKLSSRHPGRERY